MSPRFYSFLWAIYFVVAAVLWLAGVFTLLTAVVFGFVAFGFVFMGMMCVLPGAVSHPHVAKGYETIHSTARAGKTAQAVTSYRSA